MIAKEDASVICVKITLHIAGKTNALYEVAHIKSPL